MSVRNRVVRGAPGHARETQRCSAAFAAPLTKAEETLGRSSQGTRMLLCLAEVEERLRRAGPWHDLPRHLERSDVKAMARISSQGRHLLPKFESPAASTDRGPRLPS